MKQLWTGATAPNYDIPPQVKAEYHWIFNCVQELGDKYFVHGIAVEEYQGALYTTWGYNHEKENVKGEQCVGKISRDGGKTWGENFEIFVHDKTRSASHGSLFCYRNRLYAFVPAAEFYDTADWTKWDVDMELHELTENGWQYVATVAKDFWPLSRPEICKNGNLVMAGLGKGRCRLAVCKGDLKHWEVLAPEREPDGSFSESAQFTQKNKVTLISRNDDTLTPDPFSLVEEGRFRLAVAESEDGGNTISKSEESDIFASPSKPFAGVLSNGRPYLIFDMNMEQNKARRRLLLMVGDKGASTFNKVYCLDTRMGALSYPFAIEKKGKLYIVYSSSIGDRVDGNKNNLKLAIVDSKDL